MSSSSRKGIDYNLSIYLDAMRFFAAFVVFFTHAHVFLFPDVNVGPPMGREAVAVFFVLSGFVISHVVENKEKDWRAYLVARIARIVPVALLAIVVTFVADGVGAGLHRDGFDAVIARVGDFYVAPSLGALVSCLTFTNQIWLQHVVFGSAEPYWSLGFEFQYYLFFLLFSYVAGGKKYWLLAAWAAFVGPKILMYLPLWLMGVATRKFIARRVPIAPNLARVLFVASLALFVVVRVLFGKYVENMYQTWSLRDELGNFLYFHAIGAAIVMNVIAAAALLANMRRVDADLAAVIRWLAGGSFTMYLVHQPIVFLLSTLIRPAGALGVSVFMFVAAFGVCLALAEVAERKKGFFAALITRHAPFLRVPAAGAAGLAPSRA